MVSVRWVVGGPAGGLMVCNPWDSRTLVRELVVGCQSSVGWWSTCRWVGGRSLVVNRSVGEPVGGSVIDCRWSVACRWFCNKPNTYFVPILFRFASINGSNVMFLSENSFLLAAPIPTLCCPFLKRIQYCT